VEKEVISVEIAQTRSMDIRDLPALGENGEAVVGVIGVVADQGGGMIEETVIRFASDKDLCGILWNQSYSASRDRKFCVNKLLEGLKQTFLGGLNGQQLLKNRGYYESNVLSGRK